YGAGPGGVFAAQAGGVPAAPETAARGLVLLPMLPGRTAFLSHSISVTSSPGIGLFLVLSQLEQLVHVGPELTPCLVFGLGQPGQGFLVTHVRQGMATLPALEDCSRQGLLLRRATVRLLGQAGQVSAQPVQGLLAPADAFHLAEPVCILALAAAGKRRDT